MIVAPSSRWRCATSSAGPTSTMRLPSITTVPLKCTSSWSLIVTTLPSRMMRRLLTFPVPPMWLAADSLARGRHRGVEVEPDGFRLQVRFQRFLAELPSEARLLASPGSHCDVEHAVGVDPHRADIEAFRKPQRLAGVAAPDAGGQAVRDGVGELG